MSTREIAYRYAKALMTTPANKEELLSRLKKLEGLDQLIDKTETFKYFLTSPQVKDDEKEAVLKIALSDQSLINLVWDLLKKHRLSYLGKIVQQYKYKVYQKLDRIDAYIQAPSSIEESVLDELKSRLEKHFNKKVDLTETLDPRLIGGGILLIGNQSIDFSVKDRLDRLRKEMMSVKVETKKV